jgi:hypothetical protein
MKALREWWAQRRNPAPVGHGPNHDPLAEQFAAIVKDDWRHRVAELQASCPHDNTTVIAPPRAEPRTVCSNCGLQLSGPTDE